MSEHAIGRKDLTRRALLATALFGIIAAIIVPIYLAKYGSDQAQQKEQAQAGQAAEQGAKKDLATQVAEACAAGGPVGQDLTKRGLCGKAEEIIEEPVKPAEETGLSEGQVRDIVREEVERRNLTLTPSQINTIAATAAKLVPKPKDGQTPTTAQLQALVSTALATFCANGACQGTNGKDAPPVTADQLLAVLTAYCEDRNGCVGDDGVDGENGANGVGIDQVTKVEKPDGVTITMTFTDGRDPFIFTILHGKPGPACAAGSTLQKQEIVTKEFPTGLWVTVCVLDDQTP